MKQLGCIAALLSGIASGPLDAQTMTITRAGSRPTQAGPAENFTGSVRVTPLFNATDTTRESAASVSFDAGARSAWHTHPRGQVLIVTAGAGRAQQWDGAVEEIRPGDVVWTPPGVKHWHGAAPYSAMTHIAIQEHEGGKAVEWMEKVTDAQYQSTASSNAKSETPSDARKAFGDIAPALATYTDEVLFGDVWKRPGLSPLARPPFTKVLGAVSGPGVGLALSSFGFGAITTFVALIFAQRRWGQAWIAFTALSVTFILARIVFGHLPDRIGGARVALVSVVVEAAGQAVIWFAPSRWWVFAGAALTGFGYSLVYPGFGVEAVRDVPPQSRGLAMGTYTAFLDLALGIANPALGLVTSTAGVRTVFIVSAGVVLCAAAIAMRLLRNAGASTWSAA